MMTPCDLVYRWRLGLAILLLSGAGLSLRPPHRQLTLVVPPSTAEAVSPAALDDAIDELVPAAAAGTLIVKPAWLSVGDNLPAVEVTGNSDAAALDVALGVAPQAGHDLAPVVAALIADDAVAALPEDVLAIRTSAAPRTAALLATGDGIILPWLGLGMLALAGLLLAAELAASWGQWIHRPYEVLVENRLTLDVQSLTLCPGEQLTLPGGLVADLDEQLQPRLTMPDGGVVLLSDDPCSLDADNEPLAISAHRSTKGVV